MDGGDPQHPLTLDYLRRRRSAKWTVYERDVLPAWVAEMDLPLAEPIRALLAEAIAIGDTGYANAEAAGLGEAFAGFAARRLGWSVDPAPSDCRARRRARPLLAGSAC